MLVDWLVLINCQVLRFGSHSELGNIFYEPSTCQEQDGLISTLLLLQIISKINITQTGELLKVCQFIQSEMIWSLEVESIKNWKGMVANPVMGQYVCSW